MRAKVVVNSVGIGCLACLVKNTSLQAHCCKKHKNASVIKKEKSEWNHMAPTIWINKNLKENIQRR